MNFPKLFIPGPTHVSEDILESFSTYQVGHRTPEFSELCETVINGIQKVLYTKNQIFLASHAATGLWELGLKNTVKPTSKVLHAINGAFSNKWSNVSEKCGIKYSNIEKSWGTGIHPEDIDKELSTGNYDIFCMVHNETSTGVMSNLESISELLKSKYPNIIWMVDAVSSMAGSKIEVDKLGVDFIFASTQKAWGLPAGFAVCSVSDRLMKRSKTIQNKGYFFDLEIYDKYYQKWQTPVTPSIPHLFGLKKTIEIIEKEGLENRWNRHIECAEHTRNWAINHGQSLFPESICLSPTLTCINNERKWDINKINEKLLECGYRMDRGYGKLRGQAFRIAHMGNVYLEDLKDYLNNFDNVLSELKY
tara:strand:+ start:18 stop:1106 length:1089 start_codon:yes stop_codon:yes gene_type:complete